MKKNDKDMFVNGMFFEMDVVDVIYIIEVVRKEIRVMEGINKIGI
jgi:UDP-glucose:glycoprotein glucosyltransferase